MAIVANFTGGAGSGSSDQFPGTSGNGWAGAWSSGQGTGASTTRSVISTDPLDGGGNYLFIEHSATSASAAGTKIARQYQNFDDVDLSEDHQLRWDFRLDTLPNTWNNIAFFSRRDGFTGGGGGTSGNDTWEILTGSGNTWLVRDGVTTTDTEIPIQTGVIYTFIVSFDSGSDTYGVQIFVDGDEEFAADGHGWRGAGTGPGAYWHCHTQLAAQNDLMEYGLDSLQIAQSFDVDGASVELYHWHDFVVPAPSAAGGNLFDVVANVDWIHEDNVTVREGSAYYTGTSDEFSFRFGAEKEGVWVGTTSSAVAELDGLVLTATVTALTNPNRSGYHVFDSENPTWWMQQKGPDGVAVRIAPRLVSWAKAGNFWQDLETMRDQVEDFALNHGFNGAHPITRGARWFDIEHIGTPGDESFTPDPGPNPDPRTFEAMEELIDAWLEHGGMVHLWAHGDASRDEAPSDMPGGEHGARAQRFARYIAARLGPVPGWSMGYGFDCEEWTTAADVALWADRVNARLGWQHWLGARIGDTTTSIRGGAYPANGIAWNTSTTAPPQHASWEQWWTSIATRGDPAQDIIDDLTTALDAGLAAVNNRPAWSEDRFLRRPDATEPDPKHFKTDAEILPVLEAYGMAGWAAIYGRLIDNETLNFTSDPWPNAAAIKAVNDAIDAALDGGETGPTTAI